MNLRLENEQNSLKKINVKSHLSMTDVIGMQYVLIEAMIKFILNIND